MIAVRLIFKNLRRNLLRTAFSSAVVFVLVMVVVVIWSVISFLDLVTAEKSKDLKAIVTEKWQIPSQLPFTYAEPLSRGAAKRAGDVVPDDSMSWQFVGGSLDPDPKNRTRENTLFFFAMDPRKLIPMMDDLKELDPQLVEKLADDKQAIALGIERLQKLNKKIGETIRVYSFNYKGLVFEFKIAGTFPDGRYNDSAVMNYRYLNDSLDDYQVKNKKPHEMARKSLNLMWLRVPDTKAFGRLTDQVESAVDFKDKPVRCETASSGIASFLDAYKDFVWGVRWLLIPSASAIMTLVIAIAISISVRERRTEMAVLKVLGFTPRQILVMVLGEACLVGAGTGFVSAALTYGWVTARGGIKFPIAFFPSFMIPSYVLILGPALGLATALVGSILPAWSARTVKVSEVFAKVG